MKAIIKLDVPEWQLWQQVDVFFPDTMCKHAVCEKEQVSVHTHIEQSSSGVVCRYICSHCQTAINRGDRYCHECGRALQWGDTT